MRQELNNIEKIDLYLTNQLNKEELTKFKTELNQNPELATKVAEHKLLIQAIKRQQLKKEILAVANAGRFWNFWTKLGLGFTLIGLITLGITFLPLKNTKAVSKYSKKEFSILSQKQEEVIETELAIQDSTSQESSIAQSDSLVSNTAKNSSIAPTINKTKPSSIFYAKDTGCGGLKTFVEPKKQLFKVNADKGKTFEGEQGTLVIIPENAFIDQQGNAINGTVDFELVEALTLEDMILYNLTTTSNGKQLETGGMFYMNASQNGETIAINPNAPIYTETPTEEIKNGMLAFDSEIDSSRNINWITPKPLKKYLTKIDLNLLDFLPEGFANGVEECLPYKGYKKASNELVDSLYYALRQEGIKTNSETVVDFNIKKTNEEISMINSLAKSKEKELKKEVDSLKLSGNEINLIKEHRYIGAKLANNNFKELASKYLKIALEQAKKDSNRALIKRIQYEIDIITPINKNFSFVDQKFCGINPISIKTIKTPEFEQTYLATKEMEERIIYLHKIDNGDELLNIYINNLGKDLYIADSLVVKLLTGKDKEQFEAFYNEKLTNLKDVNNIYQEQLSTFYNKKKKQYAKELNKLKSTLAQKDKKELNRLSDLMVQNRKDFQKSIIPNVTPKIRLRNSIGRSIANKIPQRSVTSARSYPAQWASFGWKNIDKYTHLLANGFETVEIETNENKGFSRVFQYLNTIKTVTPLLVNNNIANANFPKNGTSASKEMKNTYCFNLSKKDGKYFWRKKNFNPYSQSKINIETEETPLAIIRQELRLAGEDGKAAMNYFENALDNELTKKVRQEENRKRILEEQKKRDELFKVFEAKQAKLNAEIERKRQEQQAENDFMDKLRCISFPCYEKSNSNKKSELKNKVNVIQVEGAWE